MCRQSRRHYRLCAGIFADSAIMTGEMKPDYSRIPRHTLKILEAWIATGRYLDDPFCQAIVMNDLEATITHADEANLEALPQSRLLPRRVSHHNFKSRPVLACRIVRRSANLCSENTQHLHILPELRRVFGLPMADQKSGHTPKEYWDRIINRSLLGSA